MLNDFNRFYDYVGCLVNSKFRNHPIITSDPAIDLQDLVQTGAEHGLRALPEYNANRGVSIETWVGAYVIQGVRNSLREMKGDYDVYPDQSEMPTPVYIWENLLGAANAESEMIDLLGVGHDLMIDRATSTLTELQWKALLHTQGILIEEAITQHELADSMGVTRNQVQYAQEQAKEELSNDPQMIEWYENYEQQ